MHVCNISRELNGVSCIFVIFLGSDLPSPLPVIPTLPANGSSGPFSASKPSNIGSSKSFGQEDHSKTKSIRTNKQPFERNLSEPGLRNCGALLTKASINVLDTVVECPIPKEDCDPISEVKMDCDRHLNDSHYQSPKSGLHIDSDDEGNYDLPPRDPRSVRCEGDQRNIHDTPSGRSLGHPSNVEGGDGVYSTPPLGSNNLYCNDGDRDDTYDIPPLCEYDDGNREEIYDIPLSGGQQFNCDEGSLDDIYDKPPPKAHEFKGAKVHDYVNAPSVVPLNRLVDQIALSSSADSLSSDENDERNSPSSGVCFISMTSRTRSFRKR